MINCGRAKAMAIFGIEAFDCLSILIFFFPLALINDPFSSATLFCIFVANRSFMKLHFILGHGAYFYFTSKKGQYFIFIDYYLKNLLEFFKYNNILQVWLIYK